MQRIRNPFEKSYCDDTFKELQECKNYQAEITDFCKHRLETFMRKGCEIK